MKTILIGNDISFRWDVREKGGSPFGLEGKEVALYRKGFSGNVRIGEVSVKGNVVSWSWPGRDQKSPGTYSFLLVVNEGGDGMHSLDTGPAVTLVSSPGERCRVGFPDKEDLEGILNDYLQAVDKANEAAGEAIRAANEAIKAISSMESALDSIKKLLSSGSVYIGVLESGGKIPEADSNAFMLCGPGEYSVGGSSAEVGIGQLGILSNASGQWKMETVQVVSFDTEPTEKSNNAVTSGGIYSTLATLVSEITKAYDLAMLAGNAVGTLDLRDTNYLQSEKTVTAALIVLDAVIKQVSDKLDTKQDKLAAGKADEFLEGSSDGTPVWTSIFNVTSKMLTRSKMGRLNAGDDLNNIVTPGVYSTNTLSSNIANVPFPGKPFVMFVVGTGSVGEFVQIVVTSYSESNIYVRSCYNEANWQPWQQIVSSTNTYLAMRPIYEACGAVWNEETGYYELNGLTDITEEQMMWIYIETFGWWTAYGPVCRYSRHARTNLRPPTYGIRFITNDVTFPFGESVFEAINLMASWSSDPEAYVITVNNNIKIFYKCPGLKEITGKIRLIQGASVRTFYVANNCPLLKEIRVEIYNDTDNISFCEDSPLLSYESVKYLVDNAANTEAVIVTISPTTYSYLSGTAQPTEEVGGTTEEWQALMTTAASKQISFATEE